MWVQRERYDGLIRAEAAADYLRLRVNQLEQELAQLRFQTTGQPQLLTQIAKTPARVGNKPFVPPNTVSDPRDPVGPADFEDMGDKAALAEGVEVDADGRVRL